MYEIKICEKKMKNIILRIKQRVAKREKKMANQLSLNMDYVQLSPPTNQKFAHSPPSHQTFIPSHQKSSQPNKKIKM